VFTPPRGACGHFSGIDQSEFSQCPGAHERRKAKEWKLRCWLLGQAASAALRGAPQARAARALPTRAPLAWRARPAARTKSEAKAKS
jgi:hypothetical protein